MESQPCTFAETCRLRDSKLGCRADTHHIYHPARDYSRGIAKIFRELPENKVVLCREVHEDIHHSEKPPAFPSIEVMQQAVINARLNKGGESESAA